MPSVPVRVSEWLRPARLPSVWCSARWASLPSPRPASTRSRSRAGPSAAQRRRSPRRWPPARRLREPLSLCLHAQKYGGKSEQKSTRHSERADGLADKRMPNNEKEQRTPSRLSERSQGVLQVAFTREAAQLFEQSSALRGNRMRAAKKSAEREKTSQGDMLSTRNVQKTRTHSQHTICTVAHLLSAR